ncbi:MAG: hypothetical protein JW820_17460 [Spirochaetales bacterium]|nr:hypothetical protein [Spirochaetales bacterium]
MEIKSILYTRAMMESPADLELGETYEAQGKRVPRRVREAIELSRLQELEGQYGDRRVSSPVEYDHLIVGTADGEIDIEVFNRGILVYTTGDETLRRIDRVLCAILDTMKAEEGG